MAVRIRSRFHAGGRERTMAERASVVAMLSWKLSLDSIRRMREARFDIEKETSQAATTPCDS